MKKAIFASLFLIGFTTTNLHAELIGEWTFDNQNLKDSSNFRAAGTHDGQGSASRIKYVKRGGRYGVQFINQGGRTGYIQIKNSSNRIYGSQSGSIGNKVNATYQDTFDDHIFGSNGTKQMSVSFLAKGIPGGWNPFISKKGDGDNEGNKGWQVRPAGDGNRAGNSTYTYTIRNNGVDSDPRSQKAENKISNFDRDAWHHYAFVWDGKAQTISIYVDGQRLLHKTGYNITNFNMAKGNYLTFGGRDINNNMGNSTTENMSMDQIRIYSHAINQAKINSLKAELNAPEPCTIGLLALGGTALLARRRRRKNA